MERERERGREGQKGKVSRKRKEGWKKLVKGLG